MILLNFSHPLTPTQLAQIEALTGRTVERVVGIKTQLDHGQPFAEQVQAVVDAAQLTSEEWQTLPILVNLPGLSVIGALVVAELHGRMGYFPSVLRLAPVPASTPPEFEVAEILNLQTVRDEARHRR